MTQVIKPFFKEMGLSGEGIAKAFDTSVGKIFEFFGGSAGTAQGAFKTATGAAAAGYTGIQLGGGLPPPPATAISRRR